jgi:hypothetical protein
MDITEKAISLELDVDDTPPVLISRQIRKYPQCVKSSF